MNKEEIVKHNRAIAEFMGGEFSMREVVVTKGQNVISECDGVDTYDDVYEQREVVTLTDPEIWVNFRVDVLPYHKEWNWLIPVLNKIYESAEYCTYKDLHARQFWDGGIEINTKFIEETWMQVAQYLDWYNEKPYFL